MWKRVERAYESVITASDQDRPYAIIDFIEYISEYAEAFAKYITAKSGKSPEKYEDYLSKIKEPYARKILCLAKLRKVLYRGYKIEGVSVLIDKDESISDLAFGIRENKYIITTSEVTLFYKLMREIKEKFTGRHISSS